ncbi:MAG: hypothetical protein K0S20_756 [Patescibacteria group bacterium]|jgi:hypothetical protein|nr:hypothetical protein [Patescibacteria group bacterium]
MRIQDKLDLIKKRIEDEHHAEEREVAWSDIRKPHTLLPSTRTKKERTDDIGAASDTFWNKRLR